MEFCGGGPQVYISSGLSVLQMMKVDDFFFVIIPDNSAVIGSSKASSVDVVRSSTDIPLVPPFSPFSIPPILSHKPFELPRLRRRRNFPHDFFVDLNSQTRSLKHFYKPVFDGEYFGVRHVAADVVITRFGVIVHLQTHLLDLVVWRRDSNLQTCRESDGAERTVRCDCYVVRFCHGCDAAELGDAAAVGDVCRSSVV